MTEVKGDEDDDDTMITNEKKQQQHHIYDLEKVTKSYAYEERKKSEKNQKSIDSRSRHNIIIYKE